MAKRGLAFVLAPWILWWAFESSRAATITPPEQVTIPSKQATPHPKQVTPHTPSKQVTPHPEQVTPHSKQVTPHPKQATTPSKQATTLRRTPTEPVTLLRHAQTIQNTNFGKLPTVAPRLQTIAEFSRKLQQISTGREIPSVYAEALTSDSLELKNVADAVSVNKALGTETKTRLSESVDDVHLDLYAKMSYAKKNPSDPFGVVTVKVTTRDKDGNEVSNCEVWYCLKGWVNYKDRYDHFDQLSSPTSSPLYPGNYVMWTRKDSVDGPQTPAKDVGSDGRTERSIDLTTP